MKVCNEITIYEVDGKETVVPLPTMSVESHWTRRTLVILRTDHGSVTVSARELIAAIANATNTGQP